MPVGDLHGPRAGLDSRAANLRRSVIVSRGGGAQKDSSDRNNEYREAKFQSQANFD